MYAQMRLRQVALATVAALLLVAPLWTALDRKSVV